LSSLVRELFAVKASGGVTVKELAIHDVRTARLQKVACVEVVDFEVASYLRVSHVVFNSFTVVTKDDRKSLHCFNDLPEVKLRNTRVV
jgi:hypothetical protein